jgi:hypothetical protein
MGVEGGTELRCALLLIRCWGFVAFFSFFLCTSSSRIFPHFFAHNASTHLLDAMRKRAKMRGESASSKYTGEKETKKGESNKTSNNESKAKHSAAQSLLPYTLSLLFSPPRGKLGRLAQALR